MSIGCCRDDLQSLWKTDKIETFKFAGAFMILSNIYEKSFCEKN